jgi:hypothetical protein
MTGRPSTGSGLREKHAPLLAARSRGWQVRENDPLPLPSHLLAFYTGSRSSVGPLYASEHVKQRTLGQKPTSVYLGALTPPLPAHRHHESAELGHPREAVSMHFHEIQRRTKASSQTRVPGGKCAPVTRGAEGRARGRVRDGRIPLP